MLLVTMQKMVQHMESVEIEANLCTKHQITINLFLNVSLANSFT